MPNPDGTPTVEEKVAALEAENEQLRQQQQERQSPQVPHVDRPPESPEEVQALADAFAEYRAEVAALREEIRNARSEKRPLQVAETETMAERQQKRLSLIAEASHYCPGCGRLSKYPRECRGYDHAPHAPIEMVSTDELSGDPENHSRAPSTDPDRPDRVAA